MNDKVDVIIIVGELLIIFLLAIIGSDIHKLKKEFAKVNDGEENGN